ncbi:hypothetical protein GMSM_31090 [Geomonas sp. Red276]
MDHTLRRGAILLAVVITFVLLVLPALPMAAQAGEFTFLTEHPGKATATVTVANQPLKLLSRQDAAAYKRNLEKLRELILKQPVFHPPRGVEVIGYFRPNDSLPASTKLPIPGFGYLRFHFYHLAPKSGKPVRICCTTDEIHVSINDPGQGFDGIGGESGFASKAIYEPRKVAEMAGFPVYRMDGGDELVLLTRNGVVPWIPVTREEYVTVYLKYWQAMARETPQETVFLPQIVARHRAALERMTPEERKMQARQFTWDPYEPTLAPVGSEEGRPLVRINPAWYDPSLPRSAFQLIALRFSYSGNLNHDAPGKTVQGDVSPFRVWQALHTSDWGEIGKALTGQ